MKHDDERDKSRAGQLNRREFVTVASASFAGVMAGSVVPSHGITDSNNLAIRLPPLIDVHCHVFNGKDLPALNFLRIVFCKCYPPQVPAVLPPCVCAAAARGFAQIKHLAPTAKGELERLRRRRPAEPAPTTVEQFEVAVEALFGESDAIRPEAKELREIFENILEQTAASKKVKDDAVTQFKNSIRREAGLPTDHKQPLTKDQLRRAAKQLSESNGPNGRQWRWIFLFTKRRGVLVDRLQKFYARQNLETALFVPGMVDFSKWLNEEIPSHSAAKVQIELMGELSRRDDGPHIHGYVSFDPLRAVFHRYNLDPIDPLELVDKAINQHGFIGVKLYPPMGFLPLQNKEHRRPRTFARFIVKALPKDIELPAKLDSELEELYAYCCANDVPIMAHASASIGSHDTYEKFADPKNWSYALEKFGTLRLNLAHLGRFYGARGDDFKKTFEWHFGILLKKYQDAKLYADLSYLEQILDQEPDDLARIRRGLRKFIDEFDPNVEHLMFGSDWTMIGLIAGHEKYARKMADFLSDPKVGVGLSDQQLHNLFRNNARSFLGLERRTKGFERLKSFYGREGAAKFDKLCRNLDL